MRFSNRARALVTGAVLLGATGLAGVSPAHAATTYVWTGGGNGDTSWGNAANWAPSGVPGNGDSVTISPPSKDACYSHVTNAPSGVTLTSLTVQDAQFTAGSLCDSSLDGGSLTVTGSFALHGAVLGTPVTLAAGSTGVINPNVTDTSDHADITGGITVAGSLNLAGNIVSTTAPSHELNIAAGATLSTVAGGTITSSGVNDVYGSSCCVNPPKIVNGGTLQINGGLLTVDAAEVDQNAALGTTADGDLLTTEAPSTAGAGATYSGAGTWLLGKATQTTMTGTQTLGKGFTLALGGPGITGTDSLGGNATITGPGVFDWEGGDLSGNLVIGPTGGTLVDRPDEPAETNDHHITDAPGNQPSSVRFTGFVRMPSGTATRPDLIANDGQEKLTFAGTTTMGTDVRISHGVVANTGTLTVSGTAGRAAYVDSTTLTNTGTVRVAKGTLRTDDGYVQTAGSTYLASGTVLQAVGSSAVNRLAGGTLSGTGTIVGPLTQTKGTLAPGSGSTGTLRIKGGYTQAGGLLGARVGAHSTTLLAVSGAASLKGILAVGNDFVPSSASPRTLLTATGTLVVKPSCTTTSGPGTTGTKGRHWVASVVGKKLVVRSVAGRTDAC